MTKFEYVNAVLGPLQFIFLSLGVWFPSPTLQHHN
jgi:hypothetical protein